MRKKKNNQPEENAGQDTVCAAGDESQCPAGIPRFQPTSRTRIKHTVAVMSGKGGVGKSSVTMLLAVALRRLGFEVGILDADITGPSIPRGLGISGQVMAGDEGIIPPQSSTGIAVMSMNLILPEEDEAVIWRGPLISTAVGQFYQESEWGELDYLLVDLPPGTADVPLTVMQSIPLDGIILVTSPQELAGMIVGKAVSMAGKLNASITGLIENMSYVTCPSCGEKVEPFGPSHGREAAVKMGTAFLGSLPLDSAISELVDSGKIEEYSSPEVEAVIASVVECFEIEKEVDKPSNNGKEESMKIAIVMSGNDVSQHFGQCEKVMIAQVEDGEVKSKELFPAPPHDCSALPNLFVQKGVESVIAGGMGAGAIQNLAHAGIRVYAGVQGLAEDALESFIAGTLVSGAAACGGGQGDGCAH